MALKKNAISEYNQSRIDEYLELFSKEDPLVRTELVKILPAKNTLLSLRCENFEQFSLLPIARTQGFLYEDPLFDYGQIIPPCPHCGREEKVRRIDENTYICRDCKKKFAANHNSISSGTKCSALTWMRFLHSVLNFYGMRKTCSYCGIASNTYRALFLRLIYAMSIFLKEVKLYGRIQCDNTFIRSSFKGMSLDDEEYPEDSPFDIIDYIPRKAKKRGERNHNEDKNLNSSCVFCAVDSFGHVMARYVCQGNPTGYKLSKAIESSKFLPEVPDSDPFGEYQHRQSEIKENELPGTPTLLISDKERAIESFAQKRNLPIESHVYRRNGVQVRVAGGSNIQKVNSLHHRLKDFWRKTGYVSGRYLPAYLILFEFLENTNASEKAIGRLFEILAQPGLGKPSDFYKNLYTTPNYMKEWAEDEKPLRRFTENQLKAAYLYEQKRKDEADGKPGITLEEIKYETGYSPSSVRRLYKNMAASGLMDLVVQKFAPKEEVVEEKPTKVRKQQQTNIDPKVLAIFDEYVIMRQMSPLIRPTMAEFLQEMNQKYGTKYKRPNFFWHCTQIIEKGVRPPLPELNRGTIVAGYSEKEQQRALKCLEAYEELRQQFRRKNEKIPPRKEFFEMLAQKTGLTPATAEDHVTAGKQIKRELMQQQKKNEA